jgi:uncharacterized protein (TIGR02145 family)
MRTKHSAYFAAALGLAITFTFGCSGGTFTDERDGKKYKIVKIGEQTWMAENLNYNAEGSKYYEDKSENCQKYGRLYDWATAKTACSPSWHLPSDAEWSVLKKFVDAEKGENGGDAKYFKATSGWLRNEVKNISGDGTDAYGFSALPGGLLDSSYINFFAFAGIAGYWWSASEYDDSNAHCYTMDSYNEDVSYSRYGKGVVLLSVRCMKD